MKVEDDMDPCCGLRLDDFSGLMIPIFFTRFDKPEPEVGLVAALLHTFSSVSKSLTSQNYCLTRIRI